jgi:glutathione S-transferase
VFLSLWVIRKLLSAGHVEDMQGPLGASTYCDRWGTDVLLGADPQASRLLMRAAINSRILPKFFGFFERILETNGTGWLVGSSVTVADLKVQPVIKWLASGVVDGIDAHLIDAYPLLKAHQTSVLSLPAIAAWYGSEAARKAAISNA